MGVAVGSGHCRWRELAGRSEWEGGGWSGYSRLLAGEPKGQILADIPKKSYRQVIHTARSGFDRTYRSDKNGDQRVRLGAGGRVGGPRW
jgi:hypothetical protein